MERPTARGSAPDRGATTSATVVAALLACVTVPVCLLTHALASGARPSSAALVCVAATLPCLGYAVVRLCRRWALPFRARAAIVTAAGSLLVGQALLALTPQTRPDHACLPLMGRGARIGVELALLHGDPACPSGSLVPSSTAGAAYALVCLGLSLIAVHGLTAVLLGLATATLLGVLVLGMVEHHRRAERHRAPTIAGRRFAVRSSCRIAAASRLALSAAPRRGPPRLRTA